MRCQTAAGIHPPGSPPEPADQADGPVSNLAIFGPVSIRVYNRVFGLFDPWAYFIFLGRRMLTWGCFAMPHNDVKKLWLTTGEVARLKGWNSPTTAWRHTGQLYADNFQFPGERRAIRTVGTPKTRAIRWYLPDILEVQFQLH